MKIPVLGFLTLFCWSAISTHIWVCNVRGLCNDQQSIQSDISVYENEPQADSVNKASPSAKSLIPGDLMIYFEFDKSEFTSDSLTERYFKASKSFLDSNSQAGLSIVGYTDSKGSDNYNSELGYRRAQTMQYFFKSKGLETGRIVIESKGEKDPAADNNTVGGRANNRRAVITIKK
jgi:outer membrane protein OmpA-like peptidoglycan-associated protein